MTHSKFPCPVCKKPLAKESRPLTVFLYCPHGRCALFKGAEAANNGASGLTERRAYFKLVKAVEKEQERDV